jgi:large subunit ribosomal protein L10
MDNPRPEKVAVVEEVRQRFSDADAALLTEYRGIDVAGMATLRRALREAGGDYKVYKNTLVRFAVREAALPIEDLLSGPTAIAFVTRGSDGKPGDAVTVAKALRDFARTNPNLVVKGGILGDKVLSADDTRALAEIEPREVLLARLAGGIAAPLQQLAGLLQALPRNFAYGLKALIDQGGAPGAPAPAVESATADEPAADAEPAPAAEPAAEAAAEPAAEAAVPAAEAASTPETPADVADTSTEES